MRLIIEYIQCYWQSFALGMLAMFTALKIKERKANEVTPNARRRDK